MKRLHVHVAVEDLAASVRFYSQLFASEPIVLKDDLHVPGAVNPKRVSSPERH
jgi:catechol 2,3-dioxygenase-like lactoylglutathione lyase family enzyme